MKLLYRITRIEDPTVHKTSNNDCISSIIDTSSSSTTNSATPNSDISSQAIENIQRPPTPPPSPKPAISRTDSMEKSTRPTPPTPATTVVDQYASLKDLESKKPLCEVTPVMRAPDPPPLDGGRSKSGKLPKLEHQHKRKKRRNKRVIAEITTTPMEDMLKLKVRLTPVPPRVTTSTSSGGQTKDKLIQMRAVRKEKTKNPQKHRSPKDNKIIVNIDEEKNISDKESEPTKVEEPISPEKIAPIVVSEKVVVSPVATVEIKQPDKEETPKNEDVLRKLGLVAISEAKKTRQERTKSPAQSSADKGDPVLEREKLEKQLRESKANRVRSLLAEKQMRDTLKSMMSSSKEAILPNNAASTSSSSTARSGTPTTNSMKRKQPPPLTPLRNAKRPNVTFAPSPFTTGKYETPLDLSSPSSVSRDNALDLSSSVSEITVVHTNLVNKPVSILRTSNRPVAEKSKEEGRKSQDLNLRTLSDAAVSLLGDRSGAHVDKSSKLSPSFIASPGVTGSNMSGKVALRIPQPHQRLTGFGMKIKPNIGVRHIPNPQAVVASQYRNQRTGFFNLTHQPP